MDNLEKLKEWIDKNSHLIRLTDAGIVGIVRKYDLLSEIDRLQSEEEFCEWKVIKEYYELYFIPCLNDNICILNQHGKYCTYCGRKIKEV